MKEFLANSGGRYVYADDLINLQEAALALTNIFDGCSAFILCGCAVSDTQISDGIVYIDGKLRTFAATTINQKNLPMYICASDSVEKITYIEGGSKEGRKIYGSKLATAPEGEQYITITANGGIGLKEAFFGKYGIIPNSSDTQSITSQLNLSNVSVASLALTNVAKLGSVGSVYTSGSNVVIESKVDGSTYQFVIGADGFVFKKDGDTILTVKDNIEAETVTTKLSTSTDARVQYVNRNTGTTAKYAVYDGKNTSLFSVDGSNSAITLAASELILDGATDPAHKFVFQYHQSGVEAAIPLGGIGFDADRNLITYSEHGNVNVTAGANSKGAINLNGFVYERGLKLEDKYVVKNDTGWITCEDRDTVQVRQIGKVVQIVGMVNSLMMSDGAMFTLPDQISPPAADFYEPIMQVPITSIWCLKFTKGSRKVIASDHPSDQNIPKYINITYLVD